MSDAASEALDRAAEATGLSDFGDAAFEDGLAAFLDAADRDPDLGVKGQAAARDTAHALLVKRLGLYRDRASYPEIAAQRIAAPLVVIGLPRSGTTFLHALLAQDPAARSPLSWQVSQPSPPPREDVKDDRRIAECEARMAGIPIEFKRMHMIGATLPEECNAFTALAFQSTNLVASYGVPDYVRWYLGADDTPAYDLHLHMLQHLQAFGRPGNWVLKSPPHMFHMPRFIETYPDAQFVFPHRDPAVTVASSASLIAFIRRGQCATVDDEAVGREVLDYWQVAMERTLAFRADPAQAARFADVSYRALIADPIATVAAVYDRLGRVFSAEAEAAMRRFIADRPKDSHGAHHYSAAQYGLTKELIHDRFAGYVAAHLPEVERAAAV